MAIASRWYGVTIDCPDPTAMVDFYHGVTGMSVAYRDENFGSLSGEGDDAIAINFQRVDGYRPPRWPGQDVPAQLHLDFVVEDLDAAEAAALELGATRAEPQPDPERWRVLLDPAGHPFCLAAM